jgi:hypothetical protein
VILLWVYINALAKWVLRINWVWLSFSCGIKFLLFLLGIIAIFAWGCPQNCSSGLALDLPLNLDIVHNAVSVLTSCPSRLLEVVAQLPRPVLTNIVFIPNDIFSWQSF